jgi:hypothetical protein
MCFFSKRGRLLSLSSSPSSFVFVSQSVSWAPCALVCGLIPLPLSPPPPLPPQISLLSRRLLRPRSTGLSCGPVERSEHARRSRALGSYIFRGIIWDGFTRPTLERIAGALGKIPLAGGLIGGVVGDYLPLVDEYYCTSSLTRFRRGPVAAL